MQRSIETKGKSQSENAQLLRVHERVLAQLERTLADLQAPKAQSLIREVRRRTGEGHETMVEALTALGDAIRALKVSESQLKLNLMADTDSLEVHGVRNLPATLARFIAERKDTPGFSFDVRQDDVRGWIIRWKELTPAGTVRGAGQFYERPYAWLEE
jgi:hypothetical protein